MRKKFKVIDPSTGSQYKPNKGEMVVMNQDGIFFIYRDYGWDGGGIYELKHTLPKYDIKWKHNFKEK